MNKSQEFKVICVSKGTELQKRIQSVFLPAEVMVASEPSMDRVLERFEEEFFDVLLVSSAAFRGGHMDGEELIEVVTAKSPQTQIIFIADNRQIRRAMAALRAGSYHYAKAPVPDEELRLLIETAVEQRPHYGPNLLLKKEQKRTVFEELIGRSEAMQAVYRQIRQAAATDVPVLITGETGTGKDLAAQAIFRTGSRAGETYLPVNLAALPPELVASELFGHEKGAFTGAATRREGIFERGDGGTVFLDEIGSIDEKVQVSLLRLIEQKRFHRLGGRRSLTSDVRIIAASNEDLEEAVRTESFREDLFYRLDVFQIEMPPLRDRQGDIQLLIDAFLRRYNDAFQKDIRGIAPDCVSILDTYEWPGNVRELKNVVQRAVLVCPDSVLSCDHLPSRLLPDGRKSPAMTIAVGSTLEEIEREAIVRTLQLTAWNKSRAAEVLGISRRALYNRLKRHGIG